MMDNMPDFDSMSPEEMMAWMESLAKRQGASEGFTTAADMDVPEIDPDTAVVDEPGYVPYAEFSNLSSRQAERSTAAVSTPAPPAPPSEAPTAIFAVPPRPSLPEAPTEVFSIVPPPPAMPEAAAPEPEAVDVSATRAGSDNGTLQWLESLAAEGESDTFNFDFSDLEQATPEPAPLAPVASFDPESWLEGVARSQGEFETTELPDDVDTMTWLESLAVRQGADPDELTTAADYEVPLPQNEVEAPAYTPFSFDTPPVRGSVPREPSRDPGDFLSSLASLEGYSETGVLATQPSQSPATPQTADASSNDDIERAIQSGTVEPEQMRVWMERQTDYGLAREDDADLPFGELDLSDTAVFPIEDEAVEAELPDWLLEEMGAQPAASARDLPPLEQVLGQAIPSSDALPFDQMDDEMPDWLNPAAAVNDGDVEAVADSADMEIALEGEPTDPWAEAFEVEQAGELTESEAPAWYDQNISDPARMARVEGRDLPVAEEAPALSSMPVLAEAELPPDDLPLGSAQEVPAWIQYQQPTPIAAPAAIETVDSVEQVEPEAISVDEMLAAMPAAETVEAETTSEAVDLGDDMPDWLRELEADVTPEEIPSWLGESADEPVTPMVAVAETPPPPVPVPVPVAPQPAPRPAIQVAASLGEARTLRQNGDLVASLLAYEQLIRANQSITEAVDDLATIARMERSNPVIYRVLGDGYMRQGKLQQALDTYREALNQL